MDINFTIASDKLTSDIAKPITGNVNYYKCNFTFSDEWAKLTKYAVFSKKDKTYTIEISGGSCFMPHELLRLSGNMSIGVFGTNGSDTGYMRISTNFITVLVSEGSYNGDTPETPTPDLWEIYLAQMKQAADNVVPKINDSDKHWYVYDPKYQKYTDSGVNSVGAKGEKGDKGEQGIQGIQGEKGDKGDKGDDGHTPVRGTDYWTEADQAAISADLDSKIANKADKTELEESLDTKTDKVSFGFSKNQNLFNCFNTKDGYSMQYNKNGVENENAANFYSGYIEVISNKQYCINSSWVHITFWDSNKDYVSGYLVNGSSSTRTFSVPDNVKYLILSCSLSLKYTLALYEGTDVQSYDIAKEYINNYYFKDILIERYFEPLPLYKQVAYIFDEELYTNDSGGNITVRYVGYDCGDNVKPTNIKCKAKWFKGQANAGSVIALINNPNGINEITQITQGSIHVEINPYFFTPGIFVNDSIVKLDSANNKPFAKPCIMDGATEYEFELIITDTTLTINKKCISDDSQNETFTYTDERIAAYRGQYVTYEWLWKDYRKTRAKFSLFEIKNGDDAILHDEFKRTRAYPNGKINGSYDSDGVTTNYEYVQMHETQEILE